MSEPSAGYASRIAAAGSLDDQAGLAARWILAEFDAYYVESRSIPNLAKAAFERLDPATSLDLSLRRLSVYSTSVHALARRLREALPAAADDEAFWERIEARYLTLIEGRYESDIAFAYIHSARRMMYEGMWKPVEYAFLHHREPASERSTAVRIDFPVDAGEDLAALVDRILDVPCLERHWRDREGDVRRVTERLRSILGEDGRRPVEIQMTDAGFFRNRGAYVVGRIVFDDSRTRRRSSSRCSTTRPGSTCRRSSPARPMRTTSSAPRWPTSTSPTATTTSLPRSCTLSCRPAGSGCTTRPSGSTTWARSR